jgi:hypothetical protein
MEEHAKTNDNIWTLQAYVLHNEAMRKADEKFHAERDRRYTEVKVEAEKAIKVKETADLAALTLARESQLYKDQQADIMREKNLAASGIYATNTDLANVVDKMEKALKPLVEFVNAQKGANSGNQMTWGKIYSTIAATGTIVGLLVFFLNT